MGEVAVSSFDGLKLRLAEIERALDEGAYRAGPWARLMSEVRARPQRERAALARDITRIGRKVHLRRHRITLSVSALAQLELLAALAGTVLVAAGVALHQRFVLLAGAGAWMVSFQPLLKIVVGTMLGVTYDYGYLWGIEPRFKMRYGSYIRMPRRSRIVLQLSGTVGSPLAALIAANVASRGLWGAALLLLYIFVVLAAANGLLFVVAFIGLRRVGRLRLEGSSAGAAAIEIREALRRPRASAIVSPT